MEVLKKLDETLAFHLSYNLSLWIVIELSTIVIDILVKMFKKHNDMRVCSTRWFPSKLSPIYHLCTNISSIYRRFCPIFPSIDYHELILCWDGLTPKISMIYRNISNTSCNRTALVQPINKGLECPFNLFIQYRRFECLHIFFQCSVNLLPISIHCFFVLQHFFFYFKIRFFGHLFVLYYIIVFYFYINLSSFRLEP